MHVSMIDFLLSTESCVDRCMTILRSNSLPLQPPDAYRCLFTGELMNEPVVADDGSSYEERNLAAWNQVNKTSPITGDKWNATIAIPNRALRDAIDEFRKQQDGREEISKQNGQEKVSKQNGQKRIPNMEDISRAVREIKLYKRQNWGESDVPALRLMETAMWLTDRRFDRSRHFELPLLHAPFQSARIIPYTWWPMHDCIPDTVFAVFDACSLLRVMVYLLFACHHEFYEGIKLHTNLKPFVRKCFCESVIQHLYAGKSMQIRVAIDMFVASYHQTDMTPSRRALYQKRLEEWDAFFR